MSGGGAPTSYAYSFHPPSVCQGAALNDKTVGYYEYQQRLYEVDVAVCAGVVSHAEFDTIFTTVSLGSANINIARAIARVVVEVQTKQVCNAILHGGYFDAATEMHTQPYDANQGFKSRTSYARQLPWSPFAGATNFSVTDNPSYVGSAGYGLCAVRYSLPSGSPPVVEKVQLHWSFQGSQSASLGAPAPTFGTWAPSGAFGSTVQQLAQEATSDAGLFSDPISLNIPTWPMGTFANPKTVADGLQTSLATVPWPANAPLAVDPTGDPSRVSGSLSGSGPIDVSGTATVTQAGTTRTINFGPTQIGTWSVSGAVSAPLVGYDISGPTLAQSVSCSLPQVATSNELFGAAPSTMNNAFLNPTYNTTAELSDLLPSSCTITYAGNDYPYSGSPMGPDGDAPVWAQGVYGAPSGSATATIHQTASSVTVGGVTIPISLPSTACAVNIANGVPSQSNNGWCSISAALDGFTTPKSAPLFLHVTPFTAVAVPTANP